MVGIHCLEKRLLLSFNSVLPSPELALFCANYLDFPHPSCKHDDLFSKGSQLMTYVNFVKTVYLFSYECFRLAVETCALVSLTHPV